MSKTTAVRRYSLRLSADAAFVAAVDEARTRQNLTRERFVAEAIAAKLRRLGVPASAEEPPPAKHGRKHTRAAYQLHFRIPRPLLAAIDAARNRQGQSPQEFIAAAFSQRLRDHGIIVGPYHQRYDSAGLGTSVNDAATDTVKVRFAVEPALAAGVLTVVQKLGVTRTAFSIAVLSDAILRAGVTPPVVRAPILGTPPISTDSVCCVSTPALFAALDAGRARLRLSRQAFAVLAVGERLGEMGLTPPPPKRKK
jgi:hypothetical protein